MSDEAHPSVLIVLKEIEVLEKVAFEEGYNLGFKEGVDSVNRLDKHLGLRYIITNWIKSIKERT